VGWKEAQFDGKRVWVEVGADGALAAEGHRVAMRYSPAAGAKVYRAGVARVALAPGGSVLELPEGAQADAPSSSARPTFGKAGSRTADQAARAVAAAQQGLAALPPGAAVAYTDGAAKGNPGRAGSGARVELPDGRVGEASRALGIATNNVAELTAIELALDLLDEQGWSPQLPVALFTDSKYAHGVLALGWKVNANRELVLGLKDRMKKRSGLQLQWMAGHVGIAGNERADDLANRGVAGTTRVEWR
jgi:ribonuclease HI